MTVAELKQRNFPEIKTEIIDSESKIASLNRVSPTIRTSKRKELEFVTMKDFMDFGSHLNKVNAFIGYKLKYKTKRIPRISEADLAVN